MKFEYMKHRLALLSVLVITLCAAIIYSCGQTDEGDEPAGETFGKINKESFVGDESCKSCHSSEFGGWKDSHHDYAMRVADSSTVRGDFSDITFKQEDGTYRFFRKGDRYMVEAPDSSGESQTYQITHTFGWTPLQQYLVDFGRGKLQALRVAWDTEEEHWFSMHPDEKIEPGDWLHWTGGAMNWNTMCADCHSTQLEENYDPQTDAFNTTWTSINVSCESCHGPGKEHVEFMQTGESQDASAERIREDLKLTENSSQTAQIETCARCHSLREKLVDGYDHEKEFMDHFNPNLPHSDMYFPDGQILGEVYVYGSFLQSKMFQEGVKCNDCHDPHSLELKANVTDNTLCMQCHEPRYNTEEHHFHEPNTESSQCINCHMTGRFYMEVDFRRDHSFRVPRPDLSEQFGTPNACNNCHENKSTEWTADAVERWYGEERPIHYSKTLLRADSLGAEAIPDLKKLVADTSQPDIVRATAIGYLGQFPPQQSLEIFKQAAQDESPLMRKTAFRAMSSLPQDQKQSLLAEALYDSVRAVRIAAANGLAEFSAADFAPGLKQSFKTAIEEYRTYLDVNQYFPDGLMNRGQFFEKQGETKKAIEAYRQALQKDSRYNPARLNLAYLYNEQGDKNRARDLLEEVISQEPEYGPAYYSLALLIAEQGLLKEAIPNFERAAELMPDHARVRYNLAISYQNLNRPENAEEKYLEAIEIAPENPDYRYGLCTLYIQQEQYKEALPHAQKLNKIEAGNQQYQRLLQIIERRMD